MSTSRWSSWGLSFPSLVLRLSDVVRDTDSSRGEEGLESELIREA